MFNKILVLITISGLLVVLPELTSAQSQKKRRVANQTKKRTVSSKQVSKSASLLSSEGVSFRLGVKSRDEQNSIYLAKFVVDSPTGNSYEAKVNVSSEYGTVSYPEDFEESGAYLSAGNHTWHCIINGVEIAKGTFQYISSSAIGKGRILKFVSDPKWQVFASPEIQLAVWDKHESFEDTQNVLFVVTAPDGKKYEATQYGVDSWNYLYFIKDFNFTDELKGVYDYYCSINGRKMISGKFEFIEDGKQAVSLRKQKWH